MKVKTQSQYDKEHKKFQDCKKLFLNKELNDQETVAQLCLLGCTVDAANQTVRQWKYDEENKYYADASRGSRVWP